MIYEGKQTEHDEGGFNYDESVLWIIRLIKDGSEAGAGSRLCAVLDKIMDAAVRKAEKAAEKAGGKLPEKSISPHVLHGADEFIDAAERGLLKNTRLLFAAEIPESGVNLEAYRILDYLQKPTVRSACVLKGSVGGVIIDGASCLYTKDMGRRIIFAANMTGCSFPGKALVEATCDLSNFRVLAGVWGTDLYGAYVKSCMLLADKIFSFSFENKKNPSILAIHAGSHKTSNSLALWRMISSRLEKGLVEKFGRAAEIEEISIRNGQVWDCRGCKYEDCLHFGEKGDCFYGGVMVEKVYPAIVKCDILVLICPNYNDSVSANIMAFINRLTAVFRANDFSKKRVYAVVVSGYSGSDIVAQQIIGAINVNKNFMLPAEFAIMETANAPGEIEKADGIEKRAADFAEKMLRM